MVRWSTTHITWDDWVANVTMTFTHTRPPHRMAWSDDPPISHRMIWWVIYAYHMGWYGIYDYFGLKNLFKNFSSVYTFSKKVRPPQRTDGLVGSSTTYITRVDMEDVTGVWHVCATTWDGWDQIIISTGTWDINVYMTDKISLSIYIYMYIYIYLYMKCNHTYGLLVVIISRP